MHYNDTYYLLLTYASDRVPIELTGARSDREAIIDAKVRLQGVRCDDGQFTTGLFTAGGQADLLDAKIVKLVSGLDIHALRVEVQDAERAAHDAEFAQYLKLHEKFRGAGASR